MIHTALAILIVSFGYAELGHAAGVSTHCNLLEIETDNALTIARLLICGSSVTPKSCRMPDLDWPAIRRARAAAHFAGMLIPGIAE